MKKFVNFRFVVTLVLAVFANVATYAQDNVVDEVVWVVGDEAILKSDVEEARMDALYNGRRFEGDPYCVIPEEIAVQKLFLHQAKLDSIEVSEAEIIQRVDIGIKNDGLVHKSEMSKGFVKDPMTIVTVGDIVDVKVIGVDMNKKRVALSMKI